MARVLGQTENAGSSYVIPEHPQRGPWQRRNEVANEGREARYATQVQDPIHLAVC